MRMLRFKKQSLLNEREVHGISLSFVLSLLLGMLLFWVVTHDVALEPNLLAGFWPHRGKVLARVAVKDCRMTPADFLDRAGNHVARSNDGSRRCGFAIGAGPSDGYGKLILPPFDASDDVWMSGYVYFPTEFVLPQSVEYGGEMCNMGVHLWRLYSNQGTPRLELDFNIPAGTDHLQLFMFFSPDRGLSGKPPTEIVKRLNFQPAAPGRRGRWQFWELHLHLGHSGKPDGYLRFYSDGELIDGMEAQTFLPKGAKRDWWIRYADIQSNISGGPCGGRLWPAQNQWLDDGITICRGMRCRDGRKWKGPQSVGYPVIRP